MSGGFVRGRSVDHRHEVQAAARSADCHWGADTGLAMWVSRGGLRIGTGGAARGSERTGDDSWDERLGRTDFPGASNRMRTLIGPVDG